MAEELQISLTQITVGDLERVHELTGSSPAVLNDEDVPFHERMKVLAASYVAIRTRLDPDYQEPELKDVPVLHINKLMEELQDNPLAQTGSPQRD